MTAVAADLARPPRARGRRPGLVGSPTPRVATRRPDGRSKGPEVIRFAKGVLGVKLLPWQEHVLREGLVHRDGRWSSRTVGVMVGRQNGKTLLAAVRALAGMVLFGEDVLAASQNRDVALDAWRLALELAADAELEPTEVRRANGMESFRIGRQRYKVVSSTAGGRGLTGQLIIIDECREMRHWQGWAALEKTRRAQPSSQVWAISSEGDEGSVVLASLAEQGRGAARTGAPTDAAWLEWSAAPEAPRQDPRAWAAANPALGHLIEPHVLASEAQHDDPEVFEAEVLCRRVASLRPWIQSGAWEACADRFATVPDGAEHVAFALDAGPELRHASLAAAWRRPDGRTHVEVVQAFAQAPVLGEAAERLVELVERWRPERVVVMSRSASEAAALRALEGLGVPLEGQSGADLVRAANAFHEATLARTLVHAGDPLVAAHVAAVRADGVLRRRSPQADIDAAVAIVLARHGVATGAPAPVSQDWTVF